MFDCTPHPGLGAVIVYQVQVDLATCKTSDARPLPGDGATLRGNSILFKGKVVVTVPRAQGRVELEGVSPDRKWVLYAIDPMGSASIAADGLTLRAVSAATGRSRTIASGLLYDDYRAWCGDTLVMTAGGDRISTHNKWLVSTGPPNWRVHTVFKDSRVAFGSLACDGNGVVVQSAPASGMNATVHAHWSIWHVGLDGSRTRLTRPGGASDESPHVAGSVVYFVRGGWLYALHHGRLLKLPPTAGYYGHTEWLYTLTR